MYINVEIYKVIDDNLYLFVMYLGMIKGIGLCYCFLIEDKFVWFNDKLWY